MNEFGDLRDKLAFGNMRASTLGSFSSNYLKLVIENLQVLSSNIIIGKVPRRYISALKRYIECKYLPDSSQKTVKEIAIEQGCPIREKVFEDYLQELVMIPYRTMATKTEDKNVKDVAASLSSTVHAIDGKTLRKQVGECDDNTFRFILDAFRLTEIEYSFESFRDPLLETLYSNDGISLSAKPVRSFINRFFRFFIDGDAVKDEDFNPERYYGCMPVPESRILAYCRDQGIPNDIAEKLMSIVKCSNRFEQTIEHDEIFYSLKVQYLNNKYAMSVYILFKEDKPLHKEELHSRIQTLHNRYPNLVKEHSLDSFVLRGSARAKPILCSASAQGEWKLQIWNSRRDILQDIRDYVSETYDKTSQPVSLDNIIAKMSSLGHSYPQKTLQTYITKSGCVGQRGNLYLPSGHKGDKRFWIGKNHELLRYSALFLLDSGRSASRKSIMEFITSKTGRPVNYTTLNRALVSRPDLFSITGDNKRNQRIVLSDLISGKRDVNRVIPEPEKEEQDYVKTVRKKIAEYLFKHKSALQKDLTDIFIKDIPAHLKSGETIIRHILSDNNFFLKQDSDEGCLVSLQPAYLARLEMEKAADEEKAPQAPHEIPFSWEKLKEGIMKQLLKDSIDQTLPGALDNVFYILRCGKDEIPVNSNFKRVVTLLFKYVTSPTTIDDRRDLQDKILGMMEAFLREFHLLKYGDPLQEKQGFGALRYYFQEEGIFPDKDRNYLQKEELILYRSIESINIQRNRVVGHPSALAEQSDKQSIKDINDCLSVMAYLGKQM